MELEESKAAVQDQFNQQVHHYLQHSPMADSGLLGLIALLAEPRAEHHTLDVACGAGFLVAEFARSVARAVGVDLSEAMLSAAEQRCRTLGLANTFFYQADGEALPFADASFDIVSCKLAFHYFPDPGRAVSEMKRVVKPGGSIVLVDRVAAEDPQKKALHNRIEKLRTPAKVKVYAPSEIKGVLEREGLEVQGVHQYEQNQEVDDWLATTGASAASQKRARNMILDSLAEDLAGLKLFHADGQLMMTHSTVIIVARNVD